MEIWREKNLGKMRAKNGGEVETQEKQENGWMAQGNESDEIGVKRDGVEERQKIWELREMVQGEDKRWKTTEA